jgi:adenine deaminase
LTDRTSLVEVALGAEPADTVLSGGRIVGVGSGEVYEGSVAIKGERIAAVGEVEYAVGPQTWVVDVEGRYLCPGLVEAHLHSYHSYLGIAEFSEALLRHGVTTFTDGF